MWCCVAGRILGGRCGCGVVIKTRLHHVDELDIITARCTHCSHCFHLLRCHAEVCKARTRVALAPRAEVNACSCGCILDQSVAYRGAVRVQNIEVEDAALGQLCVAAFGCRRVSSKHTDYRRTIAMCHRR